MNRPAQERVVKIVKKQADLLAGNAVRTLELLSDAYQESMEGESPLAMWELMTAKVDDGQRSEKKASMFFELMPRSARRLLKEMTWVDIMKIETKDPVSLMRKIKAEKHMEGASTLDVAQLAERKKICSYETASFWLKHAETKDTCRFHCSASLVTRRLQPCFSGPSSESMSKGRSSVPGGSNVNLKW
jgi:hypothetical protein